jgi:hypothetical protein
MSIIDALSYCFVLIHICFDSHRFHLEELDIHGGRI